MYIMSLRRLLKSLFEVYIAEHWIFWYNML